MVPLPGLNLGLVFFNLGSVFCPALSVALSLQIPVQLERPDFLVHLAVNGQDKSFKTFPMYPGYIDADT
jgi:hypothetical protein